MRRRITNARITHISLVKRGANKMPVLYKADGSFEMQAALKKGENFDEEGLLTALVYVPESVDSQGDIASANVIKDMAHNFLANGGNIDINHNLDTLSKDKVRVAETFLVQKGDTRFDGIKDYDGKPVSPEGAWAVVLKILDPNLRKNYREGGWQGVSMFGQAEVEQIKGGDSHSSADRIVEALAKVLGGATKKSGDDMEIKDLEAALAKNNEGLVKGLVDALKPVLVTKSEKKEDEKVVIPFEGDPTDPDDVQEHLAKIELAKMDWNDPKQVASYMARLNGGSKGEKDQQIEKLKKRLAKLEGSSNQDADDGEDEKPETTETGAKTNVSKNIARGRKLAAFINKGMGIETATKSA